MEKDTNLGEAGTIPNEAGASPEATFTTEQTENVTQQAPKPLFIGVAPGYKELVEVIQKVATEAGFEVAMMSPDIYQASEGNFLLGKMDAQEQIKLREYRKSEEAKQQALKTGKELEDWLIMRVGMEQAEETFTAEELKAYYNKHREMYTGYQERSISMSHKDTGGVIDLLMTFGFLTPTLPNVPRHKQRYAITIKGTDRLQILQKLEYGYEAQINELLASKQGVTNEILNLSEELLEGENIENNAETGKDVKAKKPAKKSAPKKKTKVVREQSEEPIVAGDAVNDR